MASEIKVDTIVNAGGDNDTGIDLATNDQILLKVANATRLTMNSTGQTTIVGEGGTTTTNLQQGLAKVFLRTGEPGVAVDSFNIASNTDSGTGLHTSGYSNNMSGADNAIVCVGCDGAVNTNTIICEVSNAESTSQVQVLTVLLNGVSSQNQGDHAVGLSIFGDLA